MKEINELKNEIAKQCIQLKAGGFRPTNSIRESWIGKVYIFKEEEEIPKDNNGISMIPLCQLCIESLPIVPNILSNTKVLTVFIANELPNDLSKNGENWVIREYKDHDKLVVKEFSNTSSQLKAFPLKPVLIEDYPLWDSGDLTIEQEKKIMNLESLGKIENYYDFAKNQRGHKIGGYPSFCQSGVDFGDDYEFIFQIQSDEKINLSIFNNGTIFLAKNKTTEEWKYYCDFY